MSPHRPSSSVAPAPRAIILAAGQGTRLRPFTDDRPKCMVEVAGRPILHHQLRALRHHGINEIVIVRGYLGDRISPDVPDGVTFIDNPNYASHQILLSLFAAGTAFTGDCIVSYADIVYRRSNGHIAGAVKARIYGNPATLWAFNVREAGIPLARLKPTGVSIDKLVKGATQEG